MESWVAITIAVVTAVLLIAILLSTRISKLRKSKKYERGLRMVPLLIHLPPSTDDIEAGGRDNRDIANEAISKAQVMYSILSSTATKGIKSKVRVIFHLKSSPKMVLSDTTLLCRLLLWR